MLDIPTLCHQVAVTASRFLEIMGDDINPAKLELLVKSNVGVDMTIYGSAIAYFPGAYNFVR